MSEQIPVQYPVQPPKSPSDERADTRTDQHLQMGFAIVGALVGNGLLHFNLNDRRWVDCFELAVTEIAQTLRTYQG